jgi:prophage DNA circulation protein
MAWENTLLPASFKGIEFEIVSVTDEIERAVAIHEYPYTDGASTEDMGRSGRRIPMCAIFYGDDYEIALQQFIDAIDEAGSGELIHPVFGSIEAQFMRASIQHDALLPDQARVNLDFLENDIDTRLFDREIPLQQVEAINQAADVALTAANDRFIPDLDAYLNLPSIVRDQLSADMLQVMGNMRGYCDQLLAARSWIASGVSYLNSPQSFVDDLTGGLVSRIQAIFSPIDLRIAGFGGDASAPAPGYSNSGIGTVWSAPLADIRRPLLAPALTQDGPPPQPFLAAHVAIQQAVAVAGCAAQIYDRALAAAALTPADIETIASDTRAALNETIALVRATYPDVVKSRPITEPLKMLALSVTIAAEKIIRARPALIDRVVDTPGNLQLIAHFWYQDYHRADELLRLNPLVSNPNIIAAGTTLRAYAA